MTQVLNDGAVLTAVPKPGRRAKARRRARRTWANTSVGGRIGSELEKLRQESQLPFRNALGPAPPREFQNIRKAQTNRKPSRRGPVRPTATFDSKKPPSGEIDKLRARAWPSTLPAKARRGLSILKGNADRARPSGSTCWRKQQVEEDRPRARNALRSETCTRR